MYVFDDINVWVLSPVAALWCRVASQRAAVRNCGSRRTAAAADAGAAQSDGFRSRHTALVFVMKNDGAKWVSSHSAESQYITVTKSPVSQRDTVKPGDIYRPRCFLLMQHSETKLPSARTSTHSGGSGKGGGGWMGWWMDGWLNK